MNLINKTKAKQYILKKAHKMGRTKFTMVSMRHMEPRMQGALDRWLEDYIHRLPSIGKTIK